MSDAFGTPWTVTHQAPLSMGFPRQEYCSGLSFPSPEDLLDQGTEPKPPELADGILFFFIFFYFFNINVFILTGG